MSTRNVKNFEDLYHTDCSGCWVWRGFKLRNGYGRIGAKRFGLPYYYELAHRLSYILHIGPIPDGQFVCHRCDRRDCVNPDHLFLGSAADNNGDRKAKGRNSDRRGASNTHSKLTDDQVLEIKSSALSGVELANRYNVSPATISMIKNGKIWTHITSSS
jgi:hypothetical protein